MCDPLSQRALKSRARAEDIRNLHARPSAAQIRALEAGPPSRKRSESPNSSARRTLHDAQEHDSPIERTRMYLGCAEDLGEPILQSLHRNVKTLGHLENVTGALVPA